ncbi:glycosyltransferase [Rhodococcoides corynebacterioides]|uniref:glycosyltransferase n=1 Tax=Rhodococcoides corynebacterioides TaxID=53972 RepID=UPI00147177B7
MNDQARALTEAGHDVRTVARRSPDTNPSIIYKAGAAISAAGAWGPDPTKELSEFNPDIVHVHNLFPNWGHQWISKWGHKTVATLHNYRSVCAASTLWRDGHDCDECLEHGTIRAVRHRCYRDSRLATLPLAIASRSNGAHSKTVHSVAGIVVLNPHAEQLFGQLSPLTPVRCIPNFGRTQPANDLSRTNFVFAGRLTREKGVQTLIDEWPNEIPLHIAGSGPLEDAVQRRANLDPNFVFRGSLPRHQVLDLLRSAKALVMPSLWREGIPTVAIEALSVGTPIILTQNVAAAPLLTSLQSGWVMRRADNANYKQAALSSGINSPSATSGAVELFRRRFTPDVWLSAIQNFYETVLEVR